MTPFTIRNLMEIEGSSGEGSPGIEARFARRQLESEAGDEGLEMIAIGSERPEGGDGVIVPFASPG
jgi:hypothetical protein